MAFFSNALHGYVTPIHNFELLANIPHNNHIDILMLNWLLAFINSIYMFLQTSDTWKLFPTNITISLSLKSCPYDFSNMFHQFVREIEL